MKYLTRLFVLKWSKVIKFILSLKLFSTNPAQAIQILNNLTNTF